MGRIGKGLIAFTVAAGAAGCVTHKENVLFASSDTVGISVGGSAAETTPEFTLGYKGHDVAVLPAYAVESNGTIKVLGGNGEQQGDGVEGTSDTYSVFGNFALNTIARRSEQPEVNAGLTKFFATGHAARALSLGFACKLAIEGVPEDQTADYDPAACVSEAGD